MRVPRRLSITGWVFQRERERERESESERQSMWGVTDTKERWVRERMEIIRVGQCATHIKHKTILIFLWKWEIVSDSFYLCNALALTLPAIRGIGIGTVIRSRYIQVRHIGIFHKYRCTGYICGIWGRRSGLIACGWGRRRVGKSQSPS